LKQRFSGKRVWFHLGYPPPAGGGLIEAHAPDDSIAPAALYPPPAGGGLIEAGAAATALPIRGCIPRPRAGASLKPQNAHFQRPAHWVYPPPAGGGLIEAIKLGPSVAPPTTYPPPAGGGLIEATDSIFSCHSFVVGIPRPRAGASLKLFAEVGELQELGGIPRPRAGASLKHLGVDRAWRSENVSPARGRGPH